MKLTNNVKSISGANTETYTDLNIAGPSNVRRLTCNGNLTVDGPLYYRIPNTVGRTATSGAGYTISSDSNVNLEVRFLLPSTGTVMRTGMTTARTDLLPPTVELINAVSREMPNGVWPIGGEYDILLVNTRAFNWTVQRNGGDNGTHVPLGTTGAFTLAATNGVSNSYLFVTVIRTSITGILLYPK